MSAERVLGLAGAALVAIGVFLPATRYAELARNYSLWESHHWPAVAVLVLAVVAVYLCGAGQHKNLLPTAMVITAIVTYTLWAILSDIASQTRTAADLVSNSRSFREPGWADLVRAFTPSLHWLGWSTLYLGAGLQFMASYIAHKTRSTARYPLDEATANGEH